MAHSFCTVVKWLSESKKRRQVCLMSSTQSFYGLCLQSVAHSLVCCFFGNVPLLHTSRYVIPCDSVLPGLPRVSTASEKRWGEKAWVRGYQYHARKNTAERTLCLSLWEFVSLTRVWDVLHWKQAVAQHAPNMHSVPRPKAVQFQDSNNHDNLTNTS